VTEQGGAAIAQSNDGRYLYFSQGRMSTTIARLDLQTGHQDEITHSLMPGYSDAWPLAHEDLFSRRRTQAAGGQVFQLRNARENISRIFLGAPTIRKVWVWDFPDGEHFG